MRVLLADRRFLGAALTISFLNGAVFAYLSGASFVLQGMYGLTPQQYSYAFVLGSLAYVLSGFVSGRLSERWSSTGTLALGIDMPVRSVVVEDLRRWNGQGFIDLTATEYTQLIGRAGRRGKD